MPGQKEQPRQSSSQSQSSHLPNKEAERGNKKQYSVTVADTGGKEKGRVVFEEHEFRRLQQAARGAATTFRPFPEGYDPKRSTSVELVGQFGEEVEGLRFSDDTLSTQRKTYSDSWSLRISVES